MKDDWSERMVVSDRWHGADFSQTNFVSLKVGDRHDIRMTGIVNTQLAIGDEVRGNGK